MNVIQKEKAARFRALHGGPGAFVIPNPWDVGSARVLAGLGFQALATSSAASASALGRKDHSLTRDEALAHARSILQIWETGSVMPQKSSAKRYGWQPRSDS
jgi:2-methylisocitrate lyase-like PEP mutase family enzyme